MELKLKSQENPFQRMRVKQLFMHFGLREWQNRFRRVVREVYVERVLLPFAMPMEDQEGQNSLA